MVNLLSQQMATMLLVAIVMLLTSHALPVEEYSIRGPAELHSAAIDTFIKEREKDPANKESGNDTPVMRRAREHAVKRFAAASRESLQMQVLRPFPELSFSSSLFSTVYKF